MAHVLTLIAPPEHALDPTVVAAVARAVDGSDAAWLAPERACDVAFAAALACADATARARGVLGGAPVDVVAQPTVDRRKRLLVADMDSTIIQQECVDELAAAVGLGARVALITERAMRGELPFEPALRERVGLLAGLPLTEVERVYRERIRLTPGARTLCATMRAHGAVCALVSGGFTFFTERVARDAGFDHHHSNVLEVADGKLTGTVRDPIVGREAKLDTLRRHCAELGIAPGQALAVGDGANDLAMLQAAGLGVAFHAKPVVAEAAAARIEHNDLTALLFAQGFGASEGFVAAG